MIISTYTREDAVADGVLTVIPAKQLTTAGFRDVGYVAQYLKGSLEDKAKSLIAKNCNHLDARGKAKAKRELMKLLYVRMMVNANDAIMKAEDKNTNLISFTVKDTGEKAYVQVEREQSGRVVWTFMATSDY